MPDPLELELPRATGAGSQARRHLRLFTEDQLDLDESERAQLLVSELVNNAVLHGQGTITLKLSLDEHRLRVEVIDQGTGAEPVIRGQDVTRPQHGLSLVEHQASQWGVYEGATHVWFEIERTARYAQQAYRSDHRA
jgi:anti-sigma regulatory factor (Ser/Thr protein kinase)